MTASPLLASATRLRALVTCFDLLLGVHSSCMPKVDPIELKPPPPVRPCPLGHYLWEPFNRPKHSVCLARDDEDFCRQDVCFTATNPPDGTPIPPGVATVSFCGAAVVLVNGMCAPFDANANRNMFGHLFGIEFNFDNHTHIRGFHRSSSRDVLVSTTLPPSVYHTHLASFLSTQRYPSTLQNGFSTRFTLI